VYVILPSCNQPHFEETEILMQVSVGSTTPLYPSANKTAETCSLGIEVTNTYRVSGGSDRAKDSPPSLRHYTQFESRSRRWLSQLFLVGFLNPTRCTNIRVYVQPSS
jgi:hypothetical protein